MSRVTPYQPMGKPERCPSTQDMWNTLAKHSKPPVSVEVLTETQSPKAKVSIQWRDIVCYTSDLGSKGSAYLLSRCGRWSITKSGHELGFTYTAWDWSTKVNRGMATNLGCERTAEAAMTLCEAAK